MATLATDLSARLWSGGTCTRWIAIRGFANSSSVPPLPSFSQRDTLRTHQSPSEWQHSLPACLLALTGRDFHPLDFIKQFHLLHFWFLRFHTSPSAIASSRIPAKTLAADLGGTLERTTGMGRGALV